MDEPAVEKAAAAPLEAPLRQIAAMKSLNDLPALLAEQQLTLYWSSMFIYFGSNQDFANSSSVIAFTDACGLGFPIVITIRRPTPSPRKSGRNTSAI